MTLINALEIIKAEGITKICGWGHIDKVIDNARGIEETAARVIETGIGSVKSWQYHIDHADDNFIVRTNGHVIIGTWYESGNGTRFCMATYGDYDTEAEMKADFDAWNINRQAEEIADQMTAERPGELPRAAWVAIATAELKAAAEAARAAFERDFPTTA